MKLREERAEINHRAQIQSKRENANLRRPLQISPRHAPDEIAIVRDMKDQQEQLNNKSPKRNSPKRGSPRRKNGHSSGFSPNNRGGGGNEGTGTTGGGDKNSNSSSNNSDSSNGKKKMKKK